MKNLTIETYMAAVRKHSEPLSIEKYVKLVTHILHTTFYALDDLINKSSDVDMRIVRAQAYQMKIGLAIGQYAFGKIDKNELLNVVDDFRDYVNSIANDERIERPLSQLMRKITKHVDEVIADREAIVAFEDDLHKRIRQGMTPMEFAKEAGLEFDEESEGVRAMVEAMLEAGRDYQDEPELKSGQHTTRQVGLTEDGHKVMETRIRIPFEVGTVVRAGNVSGPLVSYFIQELIHGIGDDAHVLIQVNSSTGDFEKYKFNSDDILSHEDQPHDAQYCKVLLKDVKQIYN